MKIPHIKLEIRILFHWLHLSGKLCHQGKGERIILFSWRGESRRTISAVYRIEEKYRV